jgi:hypothetical protein
MFATGYGGAGGPTIDVFKLGNLDASDVALWKKHGALANIGIAGTEIDALIREATPGQESGEESSEERCARVSKKLIEMVGKGCWVPLEICIARPFIEHLMLSAIVAVAGRDTGATLFGPADMCATWSSNPNSYSMPFRSQI